MPRRREPRRSVPRTNSVRKDAPAYAGATAIKMYRQSAFGALSDGRPAQLFTLDNGPLTLSVTDYGATAVRLTVPDRGGAPTDVLLGYDSAAAYERDDKYLGATVGRCANRIGGAAFTLGGKRYALTANDGANHLHGGRAGFHAKLWTTAALSDSAVAFTLRSPDGDEGYPANLDARVTYSLDGRTLRIAYEVRADGDTLCCLTNHSYFNLSGGREKIYRHRLRLSSSAYLPVGDDCLPLSRDRTAGTRFDFAESRPIGGDYDNSFDVDGFDGRLRAFAALHCDATGISLAARTDRPAFQLYTGAFLSGAYAPGDGVCLETQYPPNAVNTPFGPVPLLRGGETARSVTEYAFGTF